jgi:hypothetical protein
LKRALFNFALYFSMVERLLPNWFYGKFGVFIFILHKF